MDELRGLKLMMTLDTRFRASIAKLGLPLSDSSVVLGVSGGLDSMALLELTGFAAAAAKWRVVIAHFNHQLRGAESDEDETFVRNAAKLRGFEFQAGRGDVCGLAEARGISIEMAGREARHRFLAETARAHRGAPILLAHHADDQLELFLMRLMRGVEGVGLGGMRPEAPSPADPGLRVIRPLLGFFRAELAAYARAAGIRFREDSSNQNLDVLRNRVRHQLLPALESVDGPEVRSRLLESLGFVQATVWKTRDEAFAWLHDAQAGPFAQLSEAVRREVVVAQLARQRLPIRAEWVRSLADQPDSFVSVSPETRVRRGPRGDLEVADDGATSWDAAEMRYDLSTDGSAIMDGVELHWRTDSSGDAQAAEGRMVFDADWVGSSVRVRHWRPGDRVRLSGRASERRLHELFIKAKVPRTKRHQLLVAERGDGVLFWVEGLRVTEAFKVTPETRRFLEWRWRRT